MIAAWTPPDWVYNCFPQPEPNVEVVTLRYVVDAMQEEVDRCTEWDSTPLGPVLHVAHMLVCFQGADGLWATVLNLRTGEDVGAERSHAPRDILCRLNEILASSEFDSAIRRSEAGIIAQK